MSQPPHQSHNVSNQDLKKRIRELEEENCQLALRLSQAGKHVNRLRLERKLLLERLEQTEGVGGATAVSSGVESPRKNKNSSTE